MMETLAPGFLGVWASQIGSLSAFMGGFAATMLVMLMTAEHTGRAVRIAAGLSALAAVAFVAAAVATTTLVAGAHPEAPAAVARAAMHGPARAIASLCFALGVYALLGAIGCGGWVRGRKMGSTTTAVAIIGGLVVTAIVIGL